MVLDNYIEDKTDIICLDQSCQSKESIICSKCKDRYHLYHETRAIPDLLREIN